ncbi:MAG: lipopolysaccharide heptosyltransferase II [Geobacter sp.]|nr:lipopolysaccharide heptosyltransferase II [Geobacter sp.]
MKQINKSDIKNILIRSTNWLGDAVMTTPAIHAVRETFPVARIAILANPLTAPLFQPHPDVDEVLVYDRKGRHSGLKGRLALAAELRGHGFDLAILLQNAVDAAVIAWLARIPRRMGFATDGRGILLTHKVSVDGAVRRLHHVDYYLHMLRQFGIAASEKRLALTTTAEEDKAAAGLLASSGISSDDFLLAVNPGASFGAAKRWYPERFAAVADALADRWGAKVVITGGPGEVDIAAAIESAMQNGCLNLAGKTGLRTLMALIKRCDFMITNDSGPMHVAAAFDVPLAAIFGSTDHTTTAPFSEHAVVVRKDTECAPCLKRECPIDHRCMTEVAAEDVVNAAIKLQVEVSSA